MNENGPIPLRDYLQAGCSDLGVFFRLAIQLTDTLQNLHDSSNTHVGLAMADIFVQPGAERIVLDIADTSWMTMTQYHAMANAIPAERWPYMSPEQTGITCRRIDQRSDLYALGIILFEILTGKLPFQADSLVQWIHVHVAKKPVDPRRVKADTPRQLGSIILKLLAKTAEERYQSAAGLLADLAECQRRWDAAADIELFCLGRSDCSRYVLLPDKLYGRKKEMLAVEAAVACAHAGKSGILLVHGGPGVGKTTLINSVLEPCTDGAGYLICGQCEQYQQNQPFAVFLRAIRHLLRQLLTESQQSIALWKGRLRHALNHRCSISIARAMPEIEYITGTLESVDIPWPWEQNHLSMVLRNIMREIIRAYPLIVLLDDLQWADAESLNLLRYLAIDAGGSCRLLIVGAYRDNEAPGVRLLNTTLKEIAQSGIAVQFLPLAPLGREEVTEFVADALRCPMEQVSPLADRLYAESKGYPLVLRRLLAGASADRKLYYATQTSIGTIVDLVEQETPGCREYGVLSAGELPGEFPGYLMMHTIRETVNALAAQNDPAVLLKKFFRLAVEAAGADKGYLIMAKGEKLLAKALLDDTRRHNIVISPYWSNQETGMARAVVRYVLRTLEPVVLNDTARAGIFARDPHLLYARARAVICLPLLFQGTLYGVLYMENSLMTGVFRSDRLEDLKLLTVQISYAIKLQTLTHKEEDSLLNSGPAFPLVEQLTERELEVLGLIADGLSNQEIAQTLLLTISTVKTHILNIYGKLRVKRRVQAVTRAKELRLLKMT